MVDRLMNAQRHCSRLLLLARLLLAIAVFVLMGTGIAGATAKDGEAIRSIEGLEQGDQEYLFDMHGNADKDLQLLTTCEFTGVLPNGGADVTL